MFIGREEELKCLKDAYSSPKSRLVAIYGRRRVGKSRLINQFLGEIPEYFAFEALENVSLKEQLEHFKETLKHQIQDPLLDMMNFDSWEQAFFYLTERFVRQNETGVKTVLFLDELQWMASGRSKLVSYIKYFWDTQWKQHKVMLILCGSVASFMVNKVIASTALYGRINLQIHLKGFTPPEVYTLLGKKRSKAEVLQYMLVFGGIPKYLEEIQLNRSFHQNINRICFSEKHSMALEIERIFYYHFREADIYLAIVELLRKGNYSLSEISSKLKMPSGGGLKYYITNLELAEIINSYIPISRDKNTKFRKYTLGDEFLNFYFKYIEPNKMEIDGSRSKKLFERFSDKNLDIWFGFAFERFCLKHAHYLAGLMEFEEEVLFAAPYFERNDQQFQIDLVYKRSDKVYTICEIKHHAKPIDTGIIPEMERKKKLLKLPRGFSLETALISLHGPDESLRKAEYFDHSLSLEDIF